MSRAMNEDRLAYSPADAAENLGVSQRTIWRLIGSGEIGTFKLGSRTLIPADDLRALIARLRGTSPNPPAVDAA